MRIGIVAGEASGDLLGAGLIRAIRERVPDAIFEGVAGPEMQAAGCTALESSDALAVMGLIEPLREIPRLWQLRKMLLARWRADPPAVVVGIDSPDFNLGLEERLHKSGVRTVHYVSPSVWAWRQGRVKKIKRAVDAVLCLLPFEKQFYDRHAVNAVFVGHPMAERMAADPDAAAARARLSMAEGTVVAVMPGSRRGEVERLGPIFASACALLNAEASTADVRFVAPMATSSLKTLFEQQLEAAGIRDSFEVLDGDSETALTAADLALLASGTAALEAAMLLTPVVAAYKVAPLTYRIAMMFRLLKTPYITLPNLLTDEPLVPELTQYNATPGAIKEAVAELLGDPARLRHIASEFAELRSQLARGADDRAAEAVLTVARSDGGST